ncbi:MAG: sensor histidine kinase [Gemmatimonadales bacterium]
MPLQSLARLRLRLTAWYAATFCGILALLGGGLFLVVRHQLSRQLDASLLEATAELVQAARIREMEARTVQGSVVDAVDELHIPDRSLYLVGVDGRPVKPARADGWIQDAGRRAARAGRLDTEHATTGKESLRLHAERFRLSNGAPLVAIVVGNNVELQDRYAALIAAFGGAGLAALLLVAAGGWLLVRKSTAPVEATIEHMRRFMADAAHELRTPLTVLRSRAEVTLQQPREAATYVAAISGIESEARRLGRIVEDLLTLARADTGERPVERRRIYLDDLTLDAIQAAQAVAETHGISLEVDEFAEALVEGDAALLRQLVMILLDNAVKFTEPGGRVRIRVGGPMSRPSLVVEDSGIGIPEDQLPHIFERFYRGDPARTRVPPSRSGDGAGLGLSIARWITRIHGADIQVTSALGRGTRVEVHFPAPDPAPL